MNLINITNWGDLKLVEGCICCNSYLYLDHPNRCGCGNKGDLLCCQGACCCSIGRMDSPYAVGMVKESELADGMENEGAICGLGLHCCQSVLKEPSTCCGGETHCCCFYSNGGCCSYIGGDIPCNPAIPKLCAVCGLVAFPIVGCCKTLDEVIASEEVCD